MKINLEKKSHKGVILDVSPQKFDSSATTMGTAFVDEDDPSTTYLFYTGAQDIRWSRTSIGLATSQDGINFEKSQELNPIIEDQKASFCSKDARTPVVTRTKNYFYMILAGRPSARKGRRIGVAYADDPRGPWRVLRELIRPRENWEGNDLDLGVSCAKINESELLVYYSNITNKWPLNLLFGPRYLLRRIGILKLRIMSPSRIEACRYGGNPLRHMNGPKGSWNESIFCPGYLQVENIHHLLPTASTYSVGFPYKQRIGMTADSTPYFGEPDELDVLIDGPTEKDTIMPGIRSEIALDTPCPQVRGRKLFLYYSVMDRADNVWRTALTIFNTE